MCNLANKAINQASLATKGMKKQGDRATRFIDDVSVALEVWTQRVSKAIDDIREEMGNDYLHIPSLIMKMTPSPPE